jgi:hypothetical protein
MHAKASTDSMNLKSASKPSGVLAVTNARFVQRRGLR